MATLLELASSDDGPLFKLDPGLDPDEQELKIFYASRRLMDWIIRDLPNLETIHEEQHVTPNQQFADAVALYASGLPIIFREHIKSFVTRPLNAVGDGVWYLRTPDLRIFGWFPKRDCFVAVVANSLERVIGNNLYQGHRAEVRFFRDRLLLDEPKFIAGDDPHGVVSNCHIA